MYNDNELVLLEAMLYAMEGESPSKAIENQEKREQQRAVRNRRLPKRGNGGVPSNIRRRDSTEFTRNQYEKMGIKIIEDYDDLFYSVELPDGWDIKPTDHSMWNEVVDDKGRVRISFFYKGAFYDRDAFSNFNIRYDYSILPFDNWETHATSEERYAKPWKLCITDCDEPIIILKEWTVSNVEDKWNIDRKMEKLGEQYMKEHYPYWENINAYWD